MNKKFPNLINNGMTIAEVSISMMVLVIFTSLISLSAKFLQTNLKSNFLNNDNDSSWLNNEHKILSAMNKWEEILTQPSYSKDDINKLGCSYIPSNDISIWNLPGKSDKNLPSNYKYCIIPTNLEESNIEDLINSKSFARPGIYLIYAIPNKLSPTSKPIRKIICRPKTFC